VRREAHSDELAEELLSPRRRRLHRYLHRGRIRSGTPRFPGVPAAAIIVPDSRPGIDIHGPNAARQLAGAGGLLHLFFVKQP
jgi:hypothetical protein